ncbi:MAG: transglutaminase domain-containing protein [Clostridia bacterium]|nr:transglutaminase domain-containing protein [Clostridia bacterium]
MLQCSPSIKSRKGICYDFANLFAAFCRSQNIPCYAVDGISRTNSTDRHTWNRVYYNGTWWNVDITSDVTSTANGKKLYGFHELESAPALDEDYIITKIYEGICEKDGNQLGLPSFYCMN